MMMRWLQLGRPSRSVAELLGQKALRGDVTGEAAEEARRVAAREGEAASRAFGRGGGVRAADEERRVLWSLGAEDAMELSALPAVSGEEMVAGSVPWGDGVDGEVSVPRSWGSDEEWAYMELARLLVHEQRGMARKREAGKREAGRREAASSVREEEEESRGQSEEEEEGEEEEAEEEEAEEEEVEEEVAWTREVGEANVRGIFERRAADWYAAEGMEGSSEEVAELLQMKFALEHWAADPPAGYEQRSTVFEDYESAREERRERRRKQAKGGGGVSGAERGGGGTDGGRSGGGADGGTDGGPDGAEEMTARWAGDAEEVGKGARPPQEGTVRLAEAGEAAEGDDDDTLFV
jgi:hypothetical protein